MKKETKKLVVFEEALLSNYRHYLESLENLATGCWKFILSICVSSFIVVFDKNENRIPLLTKMCR